jgi:XTP/dITP diphosphohydrolase
MPSNSSPSQSKLVLATHNDHKARELREIITNLLQKDVSSLITTAGELGLEDVQETGVSLAENSELKARSVFTQVGLPSLADDSGLIVEVMGQAPGIFSARWAGEHGDDRANRQLLLKQLQDLPLETRTAFFETQCALAVSSATMQEFISLNSQVAATVNETDFSNSAVTSEPATAATNLTAMGTAAATSVTLSINETVTEGATTPAPPTLTIRDDIIFSRGINRGHIIDREIGENGFGYDAIFVSDQFPDRTLAQLSATEKNSISHRAEAVRGLIEPLRLIFT